jgi:elongation factor P hydroxylase
MVMEVKDLTIGWIFFLAIGFFYYIFQESLKVLLQKEVKKFKQEFNEKLEQFKAKEIQLNLEFSQYLQIVTAKRIKWLELIR